MYVDTYKHTCYWIVILSRMMLFLLLSVFVLSAKYMKANEYKKKKKKKTKKTKTAPHMAKKKAGRKNLKNLQRNQTQQYQQQDSWVLLSDNIF